MNTKQDVIAHLLKDTATSYPVEPAQVFAPSNIALIKYWGKRNSVLNLPQTSSLSVTLPDKGAMTSLSILSGDADEIILNGKLLDIEHPVYQKAVGYFDLFRPITKCHYRLCSESNIPVAAGLASSASGFAALALALNQLHNWPWDNTQLSIAARLGSGSACRSFWPGFVLWEKGLREDGMDCHGIPLPMTWPELRLGLLMICTEKKSLSSREGMNRTTQTSPLYRAWPQKVEDDLAAIKPAILKRDFEQFGQIVESNALNMHATMLAAWPPVLYSQPKTIECMQQVWQLRKEGIPVYFTQDAGPNLKLLFLKDAQEFVRAAFPDIEIIAPFRV